MENDHQPKPKARERILHLLKTGGPQESAQLAGVLGISAMAVRQHLYDFQKRGWVAFEDRPRPMGRPAKVWQLTKAAESLFPDRHNDLLLNFIESIETTLGSENLNLVLQYRAKQQVSGYQKKLQSQSSLGAKVKHLAKLRSEEGYMAESQSLAKDEYLLIENHCPICRAAEACPGLCDSELIVFEKSLGKGAKVERIEHLLQGERRCVYRIKAS
jgi:predicted ArsR family transcriptional regulator